MTARATPLIGEIEFLGWLGQAEPGDMLTYHRGLLAADRVHSSELGHLASRAFSLAETSLVHLVQRRHGPDDFSYLAVARPKAREAGASLSALLLAEAA